MRSICALCSRCARHGIRASCSILASFSLCLGVAQMLSRFNPVCKFFLRVPPAAAGEGKGKCARTPRAPARGLRPPAPPAEELQAAAGEGKGKFARTPRAPARGLRPPVPPAEELQADLIEGPKNRNE